jgi:HK97 gp10 family phage protein
MGKVRNRNKAHRRLLALSTPEAIQAIGAALFAAGQKIELAAEYSITQGSVSGAGHVASAPGEPPNRDTGHLDTNIETLMDGPLRAIVSSNARYSKPLEFGTSKMEARPFMRPAAQLEKGAATELVRQAINGVIRASRFGK